jgi:hypothetical protein
MKKVILNKCFGGFGLSKDAYELYAKKKGISVFRYTQENLKKEIYTYATDDNRTFDFYFTKDFGDNVYISDEDFKKYFLKLDEKFREDKTLIEVVEELGEKANVFYSNLKIAEIPDDLDYVIDNYDGIETLHQKVKEW